MKGIKIIESVEILVETCVLKKFKDIFFGV